MNELDKPSKILIDCTDRYPLLEKHSSTKLTSEIKLKEPSSTIHIELPQPASEVKSSYFSVADVLASNREAKSASVNSKVVQRQETNTSMVQSKRDLKILRVDPRLQQLKHDHQARNPKQMNKIVEEDRSSSDESKLFHDDSYKIKRKNQDRIETKPKQTSSQGMKQNSTNKPLKHRQNNDIQLQNQQSKPKIPERVRDELKTNRREAKDDVIQDKIEYNQRPKSVNKVQEHIEVVQNDDSDPKKAKYRGQSWKNYNSEAKVDSLFKPPEYFNQFEFIKVPKEAVRMRKLMLN